MSERPYYTLTEAAQVLGVHYETAARWVRSGRLPGVKLSRRKVIVPKEKLEAFLRGATSKIHIPEDAPTGSPRRWLALAGTLTHEEAEQILAFVEESFERVDEEP